MGKFKVAISAMRVLTEGPFVLKIYFDDSCILTLHKKGSGFILSNSDSEWFCSEEQANLEVVDAMINSSEVNRITLNDLQNNTTDTLYW